MRALRLALAVPRPATTPGATECVRGAPFLAGNGRAGARRPAVGERDDADRSSGAPHGDEAVPSEFEPRLDPAAHRHQRTRALSDLLRPIRRGGRTAGTE